MYESIEIQIIGGIATLWMNRPEVHNAFNAFLISEINDACRQLDEDEAVRVVILAGRGKSFSAGADLHWMKAAGSASFDENRADAMRLAGMLRTLAEMKKPTIARVHGAAFGGGMGLASACDMCIASDNAVFATSEVRLGLIPSAISPYVIRAIGARQSYRYFQTAERITARRACELGLVHEVASVDALDDVLRSITDNLLLGGPAAQAASKALIRAVDLTPVDDSLVTETAERIAAVRSTTEAQEGLSAFLEKRCAAWQPAAT